MIELNREQIIYVILFILVYIAVGCIFLSSEWLFEVIIDSDMPDWLKYMLQ